MKTLVYIFTIITAWPAQFIFFKRKVYYDTPEAKKRVKGGAIIISNHTNLIFDYVMNMFSVAFRKLYCLVAEILYTHGALLRFVLACLGGIKVDRDSKDLSFIDRSVELLEKGKLLQVFPEGRIEPEKKLIEFKTAYIMIALKSGKPIIPVITDGSYGLFKRARVIYGEPIYLYDYYSGDNPTGEDIKRLNEIVFNKVKKLRRKLEKLKQEEKDRTTFFKKLEWDSGRIVTFLFNIGLRVKVHGAGERKQKLKRKGRYIIAANHIDLFDPLKIICTFWRRRIRMMTADVVFENKKFREKMMTKLGCIKVRREANDVDSFKRCIYSLEEGFPLLIFPEGHIVKNEDNVEYKSGAALLAAMTDSPVLPIYIKKREKWYKRTHVYLGDFIELGEGGEMPKMTKLKDYNDMIAAAMEKLRQEAENNGQN